jgi:HK97 family phage prohead protease
MLKKVLSLNLKTADDNTGTFTGYGSIFGNVDSYGDIVVRGAFASQLKNKPAKSIKLLWQHNSNQPIGVYEDIYEDENGLFVKGRYIYK